MDELEGRVAVVTGAASGIGFGITEALVAEGMTVMLADVDEARLAAKMGQLRREGHDVASFVVDVGEAQAVEALAVATIARFGAVHLLCNNAGIIRRGRRTWELSPQDWEAVIRVNLLGVVHGLHAFVPLMLESGQEGHIVNVASLAAVIPVPELGPYNASKSGVLGLSEALDAELRAMGAPIGVTVVMPGLVRTRLGQPTDAPDPDTPADEVGARDVGSQVVTAVREGRLHLFTHPEHLGQVRNRLARITDG